ncbi:hypothetical protein ACTJLC_04385 [Paraburkholderia sp. 22099]|jgi:rhodanese-related sulfurtransferase|nr:hypothetical protein [Paraburkholderia terricola]MDR6492312.1 rhodanese-related sulfurtransferase [Paraburkholderia terricola]
MGNPSCMVVLICRGSRRSAGACAIVSEAASLVDERKMEVKVDAG